MSITLTNVVAHYRDQTNTNHPALKDISLSVATGEMHALLGASGSGKTTTLRVLAGFHRITAGQVMLGNSVVESIESIESKQTHTRWVPPEARHVGVVFQDYALFPHLNVVNNVSFGIAKTHSNSTHYALECLERVGLRDYAKRAVHELSGGEQQRVALARALACHPEIILLDEPFSNLNRTLRTELREQTARILRDAGITTLLVTHDAEEAMAFADKISILSDGQLLQTGTAQQLYHRPHTLEAARALGDINVLPITSVATSAKDHHVVCELGRISVHPPTPQQTHALNSQALTQITLKMMLRPEQIVLSNISQSDDKSVPVQLLQRRFLGHCWEHIVQLPSGNTLKTRTYLNPNDDMNTHTDHVHDVCCASVRGNAVLIDI